MLMCVSVTTQDNFSSSSGCPTQVQYYQITVMFFPHIEYIIVLIDAWNTAL